MITPKLIIHGGAGKLEGTVHKVEAMQSALLEIVAKSYKVLNSQDARSAVVYAVKCLEDNPLFNAGTGSKLQYDGKIRMSAGIMDSQSNKFTGVINIQDIKNPIEVANCLIHKRNTVIEGKHATHFALDNGFLNYNPITKERYLEFENKCVGETGTVGAVAIDRNSQLAAATSTGGIGGEIPGRVSDTSTVAGNYANEFAGVSSTGIGEHIVNHSLASKIVTRVQDGFSLKNSVKKTMKEAGKYQYKFGVITIDNSGEVVVGKTCEVIYYAWFDGKNTDVFQIP